MHNYKIYLKNKKELFKYSHVIFKFIKKKTLFILGDLGIGKTIFIKNIIGVSTNYKNNITSPTYNIIKTYKSKISINHLDLYKIKKKNIFYNNNIALLIKDETNLIEWGDKINTLKADINIYLFYYNTNKNRFIILKTKNNNLKKVLE